jgi:hypothetical protein
MTPAAAIAMLDRQIAAHGEAVTLRRIGTPDTTLAVSAFVRRAVTDPLVAGSDAVQADTMLVLSPTGLTTFVPPVVGDQADIAGRRVNVREVETVRMVATVVRYNLKVSG